MNSKYRIVEKGGVFTPQRKLWFFWHYLCDPIDFPFSIQFKTREEALKYISKVIEHNKPKVIHPVEVCEGG